VVADDVLRDFRQQDNQQAVCGVLLELVSRLSTLMQRKMKGSKLNQRTFADGREIADLLLNASGRV
jgi:hypothetical protein